MAIARNRAERFHHVGIRDVEGNTEAYLPGTGLAVWEIAWLEHVYSSDIDAVAGHLSIDAEALRYALAHPAEIDPAVRVMEEASEERLRAILPGMRVFDVGLGSSGGHTS